MQERRKPMSFFTWVEMETPDGKKRLRQCLLCGMQVSNATQHLRKHFPGTFTCPYCHMTMKRRYELRQHVITKHPEVAQQT
ncbi:hypothetical protein QYM36_006265 [Artemia franciscana]|uniref:C2H2-type domain-containing protein n=2 Tax=Artemia franciscana TaxID=6661 RepID=A0AA88L960_ARTSF|nr:hypothetical protein QYM36_006265 [Artemia franciscana]